jgi:hypothetical protein
MHVPRVLPDVFIFFSSPRIVGDWAMKLFVQIIILSFSLPPNNAHALTVLAYSHILTSDKYNPLQDRSKS